MIITVSGYYALVFCKKKKKKNKKKNKKWKRKKRYLPPILNIFVPQTVQMPWMAGFPFFIVTFFSSFIVLLALHLTQYASVAMEPYMGGGKRSFPRAMAQAPASQ
jgi:Na+-driven multidrug efflux pump